MNKFICYTLFIGTMTMASCNSSQKPVEKLDMANLDTSVAAHEDFYAYATGGWQKLHPLKPEFSRFGSFDLLAENNREQLRELVEGLASAKNASGSVAEKIGVVYSAGLDSVRLNNEGIAPLKPYLEEIAKISDVKSLSKFIGESNKKGSQFLFWIGVEPDMKNSSMNLLSIGQTSLGLSEKNYYFLQDDATKNIRAEYVKYISSIFTLAGDDQAQAKAEMILALETRLAEGLYSNEELRNPMLSYDKMSLEEFKNKYKAIDWNLCFEANGLASSADINAAHGPYFRKLEEVLAKTPIEDIKTYLSYDVLSSSAPYLSDDIYAAYFNFYGRVLSGRQEPQPRWKRALGSANGLLGEAVGQMYVEKYFPAEAKERMLKLVDNLQGAFAERIKDLDWMSDETKEKALDKLSSFVVKIGYPDKWKDYTSLDIKPGDAYMTAIFKAGEFAWSDMLANEFNKPVDRAKWHMSPQTVNAYYNPTANEIVFPAAILQPPFFYMNGDDAINYGAIGVVIGHEMTHGFDDMGRMFDKDGNISEWWTAEDAEKFNSKAEVLIGQFDQISVLEDLKANGRLSLGENIADQGGLLISYQAMQNALANSAEKDLVVDNFNNDQRFYLSYANVWAGNIRDEEIRYLTQIDPHSLGKWRVNATLPNIEKFYEAFGIDEGHRMYRSKEDRINIW